MDLIISIITGLLSGGGIGGAVKRLSMGKLGNLLTGGLGGLLGGLGQMGSIPGLDGILGGLTGDPTGDVAAAGAAGGGILFTVIGFIKNMILKK